jgi:hypothetical protein
MQRQEVSGAVRPIYASLDFRMNGPIRLLPQYAFMECIWKTFTYLPLCGQNIENFSVLMQVMCAVTTLL